MSFVEITERVYISGKIITFSTGVPKRHREFYGTSIYAYSSRAVSRAADMRRLSEWEENWNR